MNFTFRLARLFFSMLAMLIAFSVHSVYASEAARTEVVEQPNLQAQLLSEVDGFAPGDTFWTAVKLQPDEGWHTYWINPGDSGLATQIEWQLPDGVSAGSIIWPIAEKYRIGPLANYGFEGTTYLLTEIKVDADYAGEELTLQNRVDWLVCEEYCIPGSAEFSLTLPYKTSPNRVNQNSFLQARDRLPETADWPAYFDIEDRTVTIVIDHDDAAEMAAAEGFYAYVGAGELVEHAEDADINIYDNSVILRRSLNTYFSGVDDSFPLLLYTPEQSILITAQVSSENQISTNDYSENLAQQSSVGLISIFAFAFLGGLILNLMPCVFPVLSLKALAMTNASGGKGKDAFFYTLGVICTFVVFAAILLALRASGEALGWGFQLQNPWLIALLALLFVAIGLNLNGVFQVGSRVSQLANYGQQPAKSNKGSFATGVLAVLIASPCTAPFMGVALGVAITQNAPVALLIFATLGLGLAFPFILLAVLPGINRILPKPGQWMDTFKQWMAIPMYLTSVWLLWVFARQAGADSQALLLLAIVLLGTALWLQGKRQLKAEPGKKSLVAVFGFIVLALATLYAALQIQTSRQNLDTTNQSWQPWSPELLQSSRAEGPVLVNMTADWCITCLANERIALDTSHTRSLFSEYKITYLKGDWTLQDPAITDYLAEYERNGVPLYVLYWPEQEPIVLPQILSNSIIREYIDSVAGNAL